MTQQVLVSNHDFTHGQINKGLFSRTDLEIYQKAAAELTGVVAMPNGGVKTRPGTRKIILETSTIPTATDDTELIAFEDSEHRHVVIVVEPSTPSVHAFSCVETASGIEFHPATISGTIYPSADLTYVQIANNKYMADGEHTPKVLTLSGAVDNVTITSADIVFKHPPNLDFKNNYTHFGFTLSSVAIGSATLTCTSPIFDADYVGGIFNGIGPGTGTALGRSFITVFTDSTHVQVNIVSPFDSSFTAGVWGDNVVLTENAFTTDNGFPSAVSTFQDRLAFGGTLKAPQSVWLSQTGDLTNFDVALGEPSDAIAITLSASIDHSRIRHMIASKSLQIFTDKAEYASASWSSDPFVPGSAIRMQSTRGHKGTPTIVDNATVYRALNGAIYAFMPNEDAQTYRSENLSVFSSEILQDQPVIYDDRSKPFPFPKEITAGSLVAVGSHFTGDINMEQLIVCGTDVIMTSLRDQQVSAFTTLGTRVIAACVVCDTAILVMKSIRQSADVTYTPPPGGPGGTAEIAKVWPYTFSPTLVYSDPSAPPMDAQVDSSAHTAGFTVSGKLAVADWKPYYGTVEADDGAQYIPKGMVYAGEIEADGSGNITDPGPELGISNVGYPFQVRITTMPAHVTTNTGDNIYRKKRIVFAYIDINRSYGFNINGIPVGGWTFPLLLDNPSLPNTDIIKIPIPSGWNRVQQLTIESDVPLPIEVRGIAYSVTI